MPEDDSDESYPFLLLWPDLQLLVGQFDSPAVRQMHISDDGIDTPASDIAEKEAIEQIELLDSTDTDQYHIEIMVFSTTSLLLGERTVVKIHSELYKHAQYTKIFIYV